MATPHWRPALMHARKQLDGLLRAKLVSALVKPHSVDDYLEMIDATWSVNALRARIVGLRSETRDTSSLLLQPNEHWRGFVAGQHVLLSVRSGGIRHTRCFSLSSAPEDGTPLRLTIKAAPGGRVSGWLRHEARVGDVVQLSQPLGEFVLPAVLPRRLLFITAGSGITPVMSMVRHLARTDHCAELTWMHYARREVIFEDELATLAAQSPNLRLWLHRTRGSASGPDRQMRFSRERLEHCAPAWTDCETFVCGPPALMDAIAALWHAHGLAGRLHTERFGRGMLPGALDETPRDCRLVFARSGRTHLGRTGLSLLEQAEAAGARPRYGCRIGICRQCVCRKLSGVVRNELTGELSGDSAESIQLCVNTPRTDLILDL